MVRETRHLWIGNLPETVREEEIRDLFERHGRVQSVKLLSDENSCTNNGGPLRSIKNATVAFIDIRSASKALRNVRAICGQPIEIQYHEPGSVASRNSLQPSESQTPAESPSISSDSCVTPSQNSINQPVSALGAGSGTNNCIPGATNAGVYRQRFSGQHGQSEDSSSHFYDQPKSFSRGRGDGHGFHVGRGRRDSRPFHNRHSFPNDNRNYRSQWGYPNEGRFAPPAHSEVDERPPVPPVASHPPNSESSSKGPRRPESPASSVSSRHIPSKRHRSRSVSESGSTDRGSSAGSRSRSGSRSSVSTSVSSGRSRSPPPHHGSSTGHFPRGGSSSGGGGRFHHNNTYSRQRYSRSRGVNRSSESRVRHSSRSPVAASPSTSTSSSPSRSPHRKVSAPHSPSHSPSSSKSFSPSRNVNSTASNHHHSHNTQHHRRNSNGGEMHAAIKIRNLPSRSSDTSLKDGLYHEYKKHGKVSWVRVCGVGAERYAIVCFKSTDHASRAVSSSQDKLFFGCKIQVTAYHHKSEDIVAASEEENSRTGGEEEHASVGYPTRTILITGLDVGVTTAELRSVFDQYGDIVEIKLVRKPGTATHAVCEFVDIASAIRAQWGRHVFKSRETRVSFYRNPATSSLLLDGTSGVNEKQVYSNCSQYGAIKRIVMDTERILALVEFEEISVAQTAIHRLRSWVIKGKHLQVDFASPEVIKIFQDRVATMHLGTPESSSPSFQRTSSPSFGISKDRLGRRVRNKLENDDATFRRSTDGTKSLAPTTDIPCGSEKFHDLVTGGDLIVKELLSSGDADQGKSGNYSRLREGYTSPVSPDAEQLEFENIERVGGSEKSSSRNKIDLSCHETDSAIVTSSSDVIVNEKSESDMNLGSSSSSVNGDDKLSSLEFDTRRVTRKAVSSEIPHSVTGTVDGVSSTSPEPKPETVRKASPDPGIGCPESDLTARSTCESEVVGGVSDPRKKMNESKIRRSSADSGNANVVCSSYMHSTSGSSSSSSLSSVVHVQPSTTASVTSGDGNDSDDNRPGTPLCDENPECFTATENTSVDTELAKQQMSTSVGNPISLPLPGFALNRQRVNSSSSKESPSSSVKLINSAETIPSVIKSPSISASAIASPSNDVDGGSDGVTVLEVDQNTSYVSSPSNASVDKNSSVTWNDRCGDISNLAVIDPKENLSSSNVVAKSGEEKLASKSEDFDNESKVSVYHGSDSESISAPGSPTSAILNQRVQKCCESYDLFNGNRENLCSSQSVLVRIPASLELTTEKPQKQEGITEGTILKTENITEKPRFRHKFLDLDELRHQPSDIGKSVLARRSVFDEDQKRLENYGDKYEAKAMGIIGSCSSTKWRAFAFQRSSSTASTSSTASNGSWQATPISPATPLTPPVSGGSLFNCTGFPTPHQAIPTPSRLSHQTPSLSSHSGMPFPLSSANCVRGNSPVLPNKPSFIPNVFQNNSQPMTSKDKQDLIINQAQGSSNASNLKINTDLSKTQSNSSVNNTLTTPTPPNSLLLESSGNIVQPSPHQGSTKKTVESSSKLTISKQSSSEKSSNILMKSPCATVVSQSSISSSSTRSDILISSGSLQPTSAPGAVLPVTPQPMVHQGLPRAVERSVSLDSKKTLSSGSWNNGATTAPITVASTPDHVNTIAHKVLSLSSTSVQSVVGVQRRSSVDSHSSNFGTAKISTEHSSSTSDLRQGDQPPVVSGKPLHEAKPNIEKIGSLNSQCHNLKSERNSMKHTPESDSNPATRKDMSLRQPQELNFIKQEVLEMRPIHQETTVAVVASESSPFIPSRSDAHSSSSSKDSSSKDKERKAKSSSSSTSVSSSVNPPSATFDISGIKVDSNSTAPQPSQRDKLNCSKSGSSCDDKKEKKEKSSSSLSGNSDSTSVSVTLDDNQNVDCVTPNPSSKKSDEKREKREREKKDSKDGRDFSDHSSHKKDKEGLGKRKRRASSQDVESQAPDQKKTKSSTSKDSQIEISHHHRLKNTSNTERRESRDSSCSGSKDKLKEKEMSRSTVQHQPSEEKDSKDKEDYRSRDSHRSKDKSSSSSNSKEKHRGEKSRTPSEIRTNFHSVKNSEQQHSNKDKERERQRKEKNSPGKENVKGSKHHSSGSSHHSGSSKSKSGGLPLHKASSSSSSKERSRSQGEKHSSFESEPENVPSKSSRNSSGSVDGSRGDSYVSSHEKGSSTSKSDKHEKRDSSGHRRERHRSGGFDTGSDKSRNSEQKKKKKIVIEETDSSDSDEDSKKKHHSIFEVVIDNYVSMYDKVKARSNRACKSNVQTPQQDKNKKQDKNDDPFRHLKQSRAKKIDKKRSTSMDESNKSLAHTSSDEDGLQMDVSGMDLSDGMQKPRDFLNESSSVAPLTQSSDEEDDQNMSQMKLSRSSKPRRLKNKKKSSSEKHSKKRGRKSSCKQSPSGNPLFSAPSVFSNSDYESNASSSHTVEPSRKKKRLSSSMNKTSSELPTTKTSSSPRHVKSSEDSMSDSDEDIDKIKKSQHHKSSSSRQVDNYHSQSQKKLLANDVYSDSDSSVASGPVRSKKRSPPITFGKTKSKEKLGKQKSMKKSLFESSDSSDTEKAHIAASSESRPEKNRDSSSVKSKDRENKLNRKKYRPHGSASGSKSNKSSKKPKGDRDVGSDTIPTRRESGMAMKELLFGAMTSSSESESLDKCNKQHKATRLSVETERPKTPTIVSTTVTELPTCKSPEDETSKKLKPTLPEVAERKISLSPSSSQDTTAEKENVVDSHKSSSAVSSEKKKKKHHHKDKKSKRQDTDSEHGSTRSKHVQPEPSKEKTDIDSLFNSPKHTPALESACMLPAKPPVLFGSLDLDDRSAGFSLPDSCKSLFGPTDSMIKDIKPIVPQLKHTPDAVAEAVQSIPGMFSSDEDDDDDNKLKIRIGQAIEQSNEPETNMDASILEPKPDEVVDQKLEEDEKKSLFEQDKAIQSIVLLEKSPPGSTAATVLGDDEVTIPKECPVAISQEETEDAVAAILNFDGEEVEPASSPPKRSPTPPRIPSTGLSPPTLVITEGSLDVNTTEIAVPVSAAEAAANVVAANIQSCIESVVSASSEVPSESPAVTVWSQSSSSPSLLSDTKVKVEAQVAILPKEDASTPKTPETQSRKSSVDSTVGHVKEDRVDDSASKAPSRRSSEQPTSRRSSNELDSGSADVYDFHDSDDESSSKKPQLVHSRQTPPIPTVGTKSPMVSPPLPSAVLPSPPAILSPTIETPKAQQSPNPVISAAPVVQLAVQIPSIDAAVPLPTGKETQHPTVSPVQLLKPKVETPSLPKAVIPVVSVVARVKTPPASTPTPTRNTVDEIIEHVIHMAQLPETESEPALTITSVLKPDRRRSRSRSKDSPVELDSSSTMSITKVINRAGESSPRVGTPQSVITSHSPQLEIHRPSVFVVGNVPKVEKELGEKIVDNNNDPPTNTLETLIDPQTGILMPMLRKDEGQYVPIGGQSQDQPVLPKLQQPQFTVPSFNAKLEDSLKCASERPPSRPLVHQQPPHIQQQQQPASVSLPKTEGLAAAIMAQKAMFVQSHVSSPHAYGASHSPTTIGKTSPHQPVSVQVTNSPSSASITLVNQNQSINPPPPHSNASGLPQFVPKSIVFGPPQTSHSNLSIQSPTAKTLTAVSHGGHTQLSSPPTQNIAVSHSGISGTVNVRPPFNSPPTPQIVTSQSGQYQYAIFNQPGELGTNRPIIRHVIPVSIHQQQQLAGRGISSLNSPSGHTQADMGNFQIPDATTITKISTKDDDQSPSRKPAAILSHAGVILPSHQGVGDQAPGPLKSAPNSAPSSLAMTHQQRIQCEALQDVFVQSAKGLIQLSKNEPATLTRTQASMVQPPRIEIPTGVISTAASPKMGRLPMAHESTPPTSAHQRTPHHALAYDSSPMEHRVGTSHSRGSTSSPHYNAPQSLQQMYHSPHHIPIVSGANTITPSANYGMRVVSDKPPQMDFKSRTPEPGKGSPTVLPQIERGGPPFPPHLPQHSIPPHHGLHPSEQRNSDSPMVTPLYDRRHVFPHPNPAHQGPPQRPPPAGFRIVYADPNERMTQSPSYPSQFMPGNQPSGTEGESRDSSPYPGIIERRPYSPPPAHGRYSGPQNAEAPSNERPRQAQVLTPPHASQVPPQGDSLLMLLQRYPIMWQGLLALKNDNAACQMHFVSGNIEVARDSLPSNPDGSIPPLRISQRMRLEQTQLEGVARKMQTSAEHCILLALPCGRDHLDVLQQSNNLRNGFITYLQLKQAAGIVNIHHPISQQVNYVIHIFPSCDFANENLARIAPDLLHGVADIAHLLIVIATTGF